jgi:hypothetical protein
MAIGAGQLKMSAVELKSRISVVIELKCLPTIRLVASGAIGAIIIFSLNLFNFRELPLMNIVMASLAGNREIAKSHLGRVIGSLIMALRALNLLMPPHKREFRLGMIETRGFPAFHQMTVLATPFGQI